MNESGSRVDALRERLLAPELALARATLATDGVSGILDSAETCLSQIGAARHRFDSLTRDLERGPEAASPARIADYLRETVQDAAALARDLRALACNQPGVLDLAALGERLASQCNALECRAEACLASARSGVSGLQLEHVERVLALARANGRWSRRTEALRWLSATRFAAADRDRRARVVSQLVELTSRAEHRWVQSASLATLAVFDEPAAHRIACERMSRPALGDDFLVRGNIVLLSGLRRRERWVDVIRLAHDDPSEHVRINAARVQSSRPELERIAKADASHRVRASALIRLARRHADSSAAALCQALTFDAHSFVVRTAAEEVARLVRRDPSRGELRVRVALSQAAQRSALSASTHCVCRDTLVELQSLSELPPGTMNELKAAVRETPIGGSTRVHSAGLAALSDGSLARALAVVARDDFGLGVDRARDGFVLHRGERSAFSLWRALFELVHPAPDKRQGFSHVVAQRLPGALRSPPGGQAEVTATRVPGQRVLSEASGDWGRELPQVEDLLAQGVFVSSATRIVSASGIATITPPAAFSRRILGFFTLLLRYGRFAESRQRALESEDPLVRASFAREVLRETGTALELVPYAFELTAPTVDDAAPAHATTGIGAAALAPILPFGSAPAANAAQLAWARLRDLALPSNDIGLSHLAGFGVLLLGALVARQVVIRRRVDAEREAIPLVMGGWGTRGKSGSERLKAALFQGLGYECLVKTTGCEAMFIHAIPGLPAREVFIYRPYDKATVWEQRSVLALAARLQVRVFLWECMALQPELVNLLQSQWMRDDCSTITNTYPDHEDVQGPTGLDVARTIAEFVPQRSTAFTTEVQMLPLLKARSTERGTRLIAVPPRDAELIAEDLLARFGHAEHPSNVALVAALARRSGVSSAVAIAEMADNVVADLGALKTYPTVDWRGRRLSFTNGMGANDRAATLENWRRADFEVNAGAMKPPGWIVTVVNNRADRPARSAVFGELLVKDIVADRHVLIGTNLPGLVRAIERAIDEQVYALSPARDLPEDAGLRVPVIVERLQRAFARLLVRGTDAASVVLESARLNLVLPSLSNIQPLLAPSCLESYEVAKRRVEQGLTVEGEPPPNPLVVAMIAKRRTLRGLETCTSGSPAANAELDARFAAAYRAIFFESVICVTDAEASGDDVIDRIATELPSGATARVMGMQNIKGTGLDFVYRWVSIETVTQLCKRLESEEPLERQQALVALMVHDDYGVVDATLARSAVLQASRGEKDGLSYQATYQKLSAAVARGEARLGAKRSGGWLARVRQVVGETLDFGDAIRRRSMAAKVLAALSAAQISHATAALRMRRVLQRSKGGWLAKQS